MGVVFLFAMSGPKAIFYPCEFIISYSKPIMLISNSIFLSLDSTKDALHDSEVQYNAYLSYAGLLLLVLL